MRSETRFRLWSSRMPRFGKIRAKEVFPNLICVKYADRSTGKQMAPVPPFLTKLVLVRCPERPAAVSSTKWLVLKIPFLDWFWTKKKKRKEHTLRRLEKYVETDFNHVLFTNGARATLEYPDGWAKVWSPTWSCYPVSCSSPTWRWRNNISECLRVLNLQSKLAHSF